MYTEQLNLWDNTPGLCEEVPVIEYYKPANKTSDAAVVILPGGGYEIRADYEGEGYAQFLADHGISAFVVQYRVKPHAFPLPLLDARRGIRFIRHNAEKYGIDKNKIAIMGSSAGGHLATLSSTYTKPIDFENIDEIDKEDFLPNAQILCYPVINLHDKDIAHIGSGDNLIGNNYEETKDRVSRMNLSPDLLVTESTPQAFIWHTFEDELVNVRNSLEYAAELRNYNVPTEMHIFPHGAHGLGLAKKPTKIDNHVTVWGDLLIKWIKYIGW